MIFRGILLHKLPNKKQIAGLLQSIKVTIILIALKISLQTFIKIIVNTKGRSSDFRMTL